MKKNLLLTFCTLLTLGCTHLSAQNIQTITGTGTAAYGGDGGLCISASVNTPYGVAVDPAGDLFIADYGNNRIRKIDRATGIITTIAGNGTPGFLGDGAPATAAEIHNPTSIALDNSGNIYFCDNGNNRIRKIDHTTTFISTIAGNMDGLPAYYGDGGLADTSHVGYPWGIVVDNAGNVIFGDQSNNRIRKINTLGVISTIAGTGSATFGGDGGPATLAKVQGPKGVAIDAAGNIYIADDGNNRVRKINTSGIISTICGSATYGFSGDGGPSTAAKLYLPRGIAVDAVGNIYICDLDNNRIRRIDPAGIINTIVGNGTGGYSGDGGPAVAAEINQASGVAVDTAGNIYIADNDNNRIREITIPLHGPQFTRGHSANLTVCAGENLIDSLMSVFDVDAGQTETWSLILAPTHGTAVAGYTTTSTGGVLTTTLLKYIPDVSYFGTDSFKVGVTDGTYSDTITIHATVLGSPTSGSITGLDSVCPAHSITLSDPTPGGVWTTYNSAIAVVSGTGVVTGIAPGSDTIYYTITNVCGTGTAELHITVKSVAQCPVGINTVLGIDKGIALFPNPNNGELSINMSSDIDEDVQYTITNLAGQKVKEFTSRTNKSVDIKVNEPAGLYFITAVTAHGRWVQKMTIMK